MTLPSNIAKGKWWDRPWSLVEGCTPVSEGCEHCWSRGIAERFKTRDFGDVRFREDRLNIPLRVKRPTTWAVWNDLYHESVLASQIVYAYEVMEAARQHMFIVCTKRPERIEKVLYGEEGGWYLGGGDYIPNIWHLTTAENQARLEERAGHLWDLQRASCGGFRCGLSIEPLLGPVDLSRGCMFDWIIVGSESGKVRRPCKLEWIEHIVRQCEAAGVPCFVKQAEIDGKFTKAPVILGRQRLEMPKILET